jgi:hypothetical protein
MEARVTFEDWFRCAQDQWHEAGFIHGSLDETVAHDAYNEGQSIESFVEEMKDRHIDD